MMELESASPGGDIRQFTSLPGFDLFSHRLEVSLYSIDTNRNAVDQRERFRVLSKHGRERAWNDIAKWADPEIFNPSLYSV